MPPSSSSIHHHRWWRQHVPMKRRSTIILHGSTSQKTILNFKNAALLIISRWDIYLLLGFKGLRQKGQNITTCLLSGMPEAWAKQGIPEMQCGVSELTAGITRRLENKYWESHVKWKLGSKRPCQWRSLVYKRRCALAKAPRSEVVTKFHAF
jgi:hypothetical protein